MASRLLTRSKALALALSRADAAAAPPATAGAGWIRSLSSLPRDPTAAAAAPPPRQPSVGSPLGLSKLVRYEQTSQLSGTKVLPRWFSTGVSNGSSGQQVSQTSPKTVPGMTQFGALKEGSSPQVTAFSPLEATVAKLRSSPLTAESLKVRRSELLTQVTFYMIPSLLLISKNNFSTAVLISAVYHQIYMFHKEILLDYVHHDITRKWALIYFKLLLIIMAKDTMVYFGLF